MHLHTYRYTLTPLVVEFLDGIFELLWYCKPKLVPMGMGRGRGGVIECGFLTALPRRLCLDGSVIALLKESISHLVNFLMVEISALVAFHRACSFALRRVSRLLDPISLLLKSGKALQGWEGLLV